MKVWAAALIAMLALVSPASAFPAATCDTGQSGELVSSIPVTRGLPYNYVPIYRCTIQNVKAGDLLRIYAYGQVSNGIGTTTQNFNVMFAHWVRAGLPGAESITVSEPRGININRVRHHETWGVSNFYIATSDWSVLSFVVLGYSASTQAQSSWGLTVDRGYGRLQIEHWPKPFSVPFSLY